MTVQQCRYVLEIAKFGSFNEAAKWLFVAQSSLSVSVKSLEEELHIKIFRRTENGVCLTEEGAEFLRYARQITEQYDFIFERFTRKKQGQRLYISTQHYDFVADIFGKFMNMTKAESFYMALREMKTYEVINETESAYCDIGILAIKKSEEGVMQRYLTKRGLQFTAIREAKPHIYLRQDHILAKSKLIKAEMIKEFPYVSYEQGKHNISLFSEEIDHISGDKKVEISDRASLMNVLLGTDSYTVGTGIMPSILNNGRIVSVPFETDDSYLIGYLLREDSNLSVLAKQFLKMLEEGLKNI